MAEVFQGCDSAALLSLGRVDFFLLGTQTCPLQLCLSALAHSGRLEVPAFLCNRRESKVSACDFTCSGVPFLEGSPVSRDVDHVAVSLLPFSVSSAAQGLQQVTHSLSKGTFSSELSSAVAEGLFLLGLEGNFCASLNPGRRAQPILLADQEVSVVLSGGDVGKLLANGARE